MNQIDPLPVFDHAWVANLPDDPWEAVAQVCSHFLEWFSRLPDGALSDHYVAIMDAYALLCALISRHKEHIKGIEDPYQVMGNHQADVDTILARFNSANTRAQQVLFSRSSTQHFTASSERYEAMLAGELRIEFHDDEIKQLQILINELRDAISGCESLEANHKYRLLRRLERLQKELHKEVSNLDSMWMFIGDAAFVLGQAAEDAKPIFGGIRAIMKIARIAMGRTHGLPAGAIQDFLLEDKNVVTEPTSIESAESSSA